MSQVKHTPKGIEDMGLTHMTEIKAKYIPHLLEGRDLMGAAANGNGKTLNSGTAQQIVAQAKK